MKFVLATLMVLSSQAFAQFGSGIPDDAADNVLELAAVQKSAIRSSAAVQAKAAALGGSIVRVVSVNSPDHAAVYKVKLNNGCSFYAGVNYAANFHDGIESVVVFSNPATCN